MKSIDPECESVTEIQLKELEDISVKQHVAVSIKVIGVESPV